MLALPHGEIDAPQDVIGSERLVDAAEPQHEIPVAGGGGGRRHESKRVGREENSWPWRTRR